MRSLCAHRRYKGLFGWICGGGGEEKAHGKATKTANPSQTQQHFLEGGGRVLVSDTLLVEHGGLLTALAARCTEAIFGSNGAAPPPSSDKALAAICTRADVLGSFVIPPPSLTLLSPVSASQNRDAALVDDALTVGGTFGENVERQLDVDGGGDRFDDDGVYSVRIERSLVPRVALRGRARRCTRSSSISAATAGDGNVDKTAATCQFMLHSIDVHPKPSLVATGRLSALPLASVSDQPIVSPFPRSSQVPMLQRLLFLPLVGSGNGYKIAANCLTM